MRVLTEAVLRSDLPKDIKTYTIPEGAYVTPEARRYAQQHGIQLVSGEWKPMTRTRIDTDSTYPYVDAVTGERYRKKPENMTHLSGNRLVEKNHPRILFRGKLDTLQSEIILLQCEIKDTGREIVFSGLEEILTLTRNILAAEVKEEPLGEFRLLGRNDQELREASHNVVKSMGMQHPIPDYRMGLVAAKLNHLRALSREVELAAVNAFTGKDEREDIILALNRMSSAIYLVYLQEVKDHGK